MAGEWRRPERLPLPFGLGEAVADGDDGCRVVAQSAMAADHFDVLAHRPLRFQTSLPRGDAIGAGVDGGDRDRYRASELLVDKLRRRRAVPDRATRVSRCCPPGFRRRDGEPSVIT